MRTIRGSAQVSKSQHVLWDMLQDVQSYPKFIHFMKKVEVLTDTKRGGEWLDTVTTFYGVPMTFHHTIRQMEPEHTLILDIKLPFKGKMTQEFTLEKQDEQTTKISAVVSYEFPHPLIDFIVGELLAPRLRIMIRESFKKINAYSV